MKVFLDTNVILDFYDSDRGHYQPAAIVFDLASKGEIEVSVCALSFVTTAIDMQVVEKALSQERRDFEDAVQYFSSQTIDADIILTRDRKGFNDFGSVAKCG